MVLKTSEEDQQDTLGEEISSVNPGIETGDLLESATRITLATFGGGLVGLALERQKHAAIPAQQRRRGPPVALKGKASLPKTWSLSCMIFTLILETARLASPTSIFYDSMTKRDDCPTAAKSFESRVQRQGVICIGDYAIGGVAAGLAGAMARRPPPEASTGVKLVLPTTILKSGRRPLIIWGIGMGLGLGLTAGIFQAAVNIGEMYLEHEQDNKPPSITTDDE